MALKRVHYRRYCASCGISLFADAHVCPRCLRPVCAVLPDEVPASDESLVLEETSAPRPSHHCARVCGKCGESMLDVALFCVACSTTAEVRLHPKSLPSWGSRPALPLHLVRQSARPRLEVSRSTEVGLLVESYASLHPAPIAALAFVPQPVRRSFQPLRRPRLQLPSLVNELGPYCQGCGGDYRQDTRVLEVDHLLSRRAGGLDNYDNLVLLCPPCNRVKGSRLTLSELRRRNRESGYMRNESNLASLALLGTKAVPVLPPTKAVPQSQVPEIGSISSGLGCLVAIGVFFLLVVLLLVVNSCS